MNDGDDRISGATAEGTASQFASDKVMERAWAKPKEASDLGSTR